MEDLMKKQSAALLTAAMVGQTSEIESIKTIVDLWKAHYHQLDVETDVDYMSSILTTARVWDIKPELVNVPEVIHIHRLVRAEFEKQVDFVVADDQKVLCCHLAAAYIAITPEIETVTQIVSTFRKFIESVEINDDYDKLAAYLVMGRMHDSKNKIEPYEVPALIRRMRELMMEEDGA